MMGVIYSHYSNEYIDLDTTECVELDDGDFVRLDDDEALIEAYDAGLISDRRMIEDLGFTEFDLKQIYYGRR